MTEIREETVNTGQRKQEKDERLVHENFVHASSSRLIELWKTSRALLQNKDKLEDLSSASLAEQTYKESSLELFFRSHGGEYREDYNRWLEIKKKKQQEWEGQMLAKYGADWEQHVTDADRQLLVYSTDEQEAYATHKAIEARAMKLKKREVQELQRLEGKEKKERKVNFFKLVKERTLQTYQFLGEREVHKAVYSFDFVFFYMNQLMKGMLGQGIRHLQGREQLTEAQELEQMVHKGAIYVKTLVMERREQRVNRVARGATIASMSSQPRLSVS